MAHRTHKKNERGFTLIELMIVVAIIGILAALALPKFASLVEKSREAATKGNVNSMRSAVSIYYGDTEGVYPVYIETGGIYTFSKYIESLPPVKATHSGIGANGTLETPSGTSVLYTVDETTWATAGTGWRYNSQDGHVYVNSSTTDSKNTAYSTYGY